MADTIAATSPSGRRPPRAPPAATRAPSSGVDRRQAGGDVGEQARPHRRIVDQAGQLVRLAAARQRRRSCRACASACRAAPAAGRPAAARASPSTSASAARVSVIARVKSPAVERRRDVGLQQVEMVHAEQLGRVGHLLPQLQHPLEQAALLRVRVARAGRRPPPRWRRSSARGWSWAAYQWWAISAGARPAPTSSRPGLDGRRVAGVQPGVLAGQQVVVDGLAHQGVPELVAAVGVGQDELRGDRRAQRRLQLAGRARRPPRPAGRGRPGCRRRRRCAAPAGPPRRAGRPGPAAGRAACRAGRRRRAGSAQAASSSTKNGLPCARSKMLSTRPRPGSAPRIWWRISAVPSRSSRSSVEPLDAAHPVELGQERPQRVAAVQLVGAVGADQQHRRGAGRADQERDQVAGGPVGPVQVLDRRGPAGARGRQPANRPATRSNR